MLIERTLFLAVPVMVKRCTSDAPNGGERTERNGKHGEAERGEE
jgi:hypothetical protein